MRRTILVLLCLGYLSSAPTQGAIVPVTVADFVDTFKAKPLEFAVGETMKYDI